MATLTIKNFPEALYAQLKARAAERRRSINSEAIVAIETALGAPGPRDTEALVEMLKRGRARMKHLHATNAEIDAAKGSGRA